LEETVELLEPTTEGKQIQFAVELDPNPLVIEGDSDQLKQVFLNLMQNAVEAMNGVGRVTVGTRIEDKEVQVLIRDTGPGIPPEIREKIFEPFSPPRPKGPD